VSDFGPLTLIPHPTALTRDCVLVDPNYAGVATLDGVKSKPLASNGDNEKFLMTDGEDPRRQEREGPRRDRRPGLIAESPANA
jgi:hypothetical protein